MAALSHVGSSVAAFNRKGCAQPRHLVAIECHHVKTHAGVAATPMASNQIGYQQRRAAGQAGALVMAHACRCATVSAVRPRAHFDEHQLVALSHDEVYLSSAAAQVARQGNQAGLVQAFERTVFVRGADTLGRGYQNRLLRIVVWWVRRARGAFCGGATPFELALLCFAGEPIGNILERVGHESGIPREGGRLH